MCAILVFCIDYWWQIIINKHTQDDEFVNSEPNNAKIFKFLPIYKCFTTSFIFSYLCIFVNCHTTLHVCNICVMFVSRPTPVSLCLSSCLAWWWVKTGFHCSKDDWRSSTASKHCQVCMHLYVSHDYVFFAVFSSLISTLTLCLM